MNRGMPAEAYRPMSVERSGKMAETKERLVKTNKLANNGEQFCSDLLAATAAKGFDGVIRPISPDPGDAWCE